MTGLWASLRALRENIRAPLVLLAIPLFLGAMVVSVLMRDLTSFQRAEAGSERVRTAGWQDAAEAMLATQPDYARKFAFYQLKPGQTLDDVAETYSVSRDELQRDNPGRIIAGTTIKVRPVEKPLRPKSSTHSIDRAVVVKDGDLLRIAHDHGIGRQIVTDVPELAAFLAKYDAIDRIGPKHYRLNRAISVEGNIRVDITSATVDRLDLVSTPTTFASLVFDESSALLRGVTISSVNPATGHPDSTSKDGRSFIRMKNGRMDVIDSAISYLGNGLKDTLTGKAKAATAQKEGGTYGVAWRISDDRLGAEIATGWVSGSRFEHNHFGAYTFGASGMVWRANWFHRNEVYGLDPHDDSNNALVEANVFEDNGKHGFIVSKRCNFNVIRDNVSVGNALHGFMLHADSTRNVIEDNVAYGNVDNFVIYGSSFDTIRNNRSYAPRSSHIRVNAGADHTFVTGNQLYGGPRGIYVYGRSSDTFISGNSLHGVPESVQTSGADQTFYGGNLDAVFNYDIGAGDVVIYGENRTGTSSYVPELRTVLRELDIKAPRGS